MNKQYLAKRINGISNLLKVLEFSNKKQKLMLSQSECSDMQLIVNYSHKKRIVSMKAYQIQLNRMKPRLIYLCD